MRKLRQDVASDCSGTIKLYPEEPEDLWHVYNLLRPTDVLTAPAQRKIAEVSSTGTVTSSRVQTTLSIRVLSLDFDPAASELHVKGRVAAENAYVPLGAHHTLDLALHRNFTITKDVGGWDTVAFRLLKEACNTTGKASIMAVVLHEGLAHVCALTEHQTVLLQKVAYSVPKKRVNSAAKVTDHDKSINRFFAAVQRTIMSHLTDSHKAVVLASPGFVATALKNYMKEQVSKGGDKALRRVVEMLVLAHSASGYMHSLHEALKDPTVIAQLKVTKFAQETNAMARFYDVLRRDVGKAVYGPKEVEQAVQLGAVGKGGGELLISDALFRSLDIKERKRWVSVVEAVRSESGEVRIFSSSHESGIRLGSIGGVAALTVFPVDDDADSDDEAGDGDS
ncbi:MAG: Translation factor pelota [Vezdaea aestivalis]|nr:MAG: Translation factor pelota [Vezdaea aestivalis]